MFTWRHILWLGICLILGTAGFLLYRRKRPAMKTVLTVALVISMLSEITKIMSQIQMVPSANGQMMLPYLPLNHLPLHFCSIQILLIAYARFSQNPQKRESVLAFMAPTCSLGGIFALLLPSIFTTTVPVERAFVSPVTYQFFLFHAMIVCLGIIIACSGEIQWQWKHFRRSLLLVCLMGLVSIYLNSVFASPTYVDGELASVDFWTNFFFTYQNPLGIRITLLWQWYLYLAILLALTVVLLFLFYWPLIRKTESRTSD